MIKICFICIECADLKFYHFAPSFFAFLLQIKKNRPACGSRSVIVEDRYDLFYQLLISFMIFAKAFYILIGYVL